MGQHRFTSPWYSEVRSIHAEPYENRRLAEIAERTAILEESPAHNAAVHAVRSEDAPSWFDLVTDDERRELALAEQAFADAKKALEPVKAERDATIRRLKIRCDARMRRAKEDGDD